MPPKKFPSYLWNVTDWLTDPEVGQMTAEQRGWYRQLLDLCWNGREQGYLDVTEDQLKSFSGYAASLVRVKQRYFEMKIAWEEAKDNLSTEIATGVEQPLTRLLSLSREAWVKECEDQWAAVFSKFEHGAQGWYNARLLEARGQIDRVRDQRSGAGKASAESRNRHKNEGLRESSSTGTQQPLNPVEREVNESQHETPVDNSNGNSKSKDLKLKQKGSEFALQPVPLQQGGKGEKGISLVHDVWDYWREIMQSPRSALDNKRIIKIKEALKHFTPDQLKTAIRGCSISDFHMGREPDHPKLHNGIRLICQDAEHIEKFISFTIVNPNTKEGSNGSSKQFSAEEYIRKLDEEESRIDAAGDTSVLLDP